MDIVLGNRHGVQILSEAVCISHNANTHEKDINSTILPSALGKL